MIVWAIAAEVVLVYLALWAAGVQRWLLEGIAAGAVIIATQTGWLLLLGCIARRL